MDKHEAKILPISDEVKSFNHKDTKTWCRGIVGRDHQVEWIEERWGRRLICTVCGKYLQWKFNRSVSFPVELKRLRKAAGWTQEKLGIEMMKCYSNPNPNPIAALNLVHNLENSPKYTDWQGGIPNYEARPFGEFRRAFEVLGYNVITAVVSDENNTDAADTNS